MSNDLMPLYNDTALQITPELSRFPNPIPTNYQGTIFNFPHPGQTDQEKLSQEIAEELRNTTLVDQPLPVFNR